MVTNVDYPTDPDVSFTYDQQGRRLSMTDGSGTTTWTYDAVGRAASETQGRSGRTLHFGYDSHSQRTGLQITGGSTPWQTACGYDNAGRLHSVLDDRLPSGQPFVYTYASNANLVAQISGPGGLTTMKTYDPLGRLLSTEARRADQSVVDRFAYSYDAAGQRQQETTPEGQRTFGYDQYRQLTSATTAVLLPAPGSQFHGYAYDPIGNRQSATADLGSGALTTNYASNTVNQYTALTGAQIDSPAYDVNGNTISMAGMTLIWDEENRLVEVSDSTRTVSYVYDGLGRRVEKTEVTGGTANAIRYVYDGWRMMEETDATGATLRSYTRGLDMFGSLEGAGGIGGLLAIALPSGGSITAASYFCDGNGNVIHLVGDDGSSLAHYQYSPFGEKLSATGPLADVNPFQFSSKECDGLTGFYYYGYRWYDPMLGRWLSQDPLEEKDGIFLYGFVGNDPFCRIDPLGLKLSGAIDIRTEDRPGTGAGYGLLSTTEEGNTGLDGVPSVTPLGKLSKECKKGEIFFEGVRFYIKIYSWYYSHTTLDYKISPSPQEHENEHVNRYLKAIGQAFSVFDGPGRCTCPEKIASCYQKVVNAVIKEMEVRIKIYNNEWELEDVRQVKIRDAAQTKLDAARKELDSIKGEAARLKAECEKD